MKAYYPDTLVDIAQHTTAPLQKSSLRIDSVSRVNGENFPAIEGRFLYVEKCDYPVLLSFVNQATNETQCIVARMGAVIDAPFKGLTVTHPLLTPSGGDVYTLSYVVGRQPCAEFSNEFSLPFGTMQASVSLATSTAIAQNLLIHIPQGVRWIDDLTITMPGLTVTSATYDVMRLSASAGSQVISPSLNSAGIAFIGFSNGGVLDVTAPYAGWFRLRDVRIPVPSAASAAPYGGIINVNIVGTGFQVNFAVTGASIKANFA